MSSSAPKQGWIDVGQTSGVEGREDFQLGWQNKAGSLFSNVSILDVGAGLGLSRSRLNPFGMNNVSLQDIAPGLEVDIRDPVSAIPDKSYDVVTAFDVIEHVEQDEEFLRHLTRIARRAVFFTTPNFDHSHCANRFHCREYSPLQLAKLVRGYSAKFFAGDPHGSAIQELNINRFAGTLDDATRNRPAPPHNQPHHAALLDLSVERNCRPGALSILLPTTGRPTLHSTLQSCMDQEWRPGDELLVINDGNHPQVDVLAHLYAGKYPGRIRIIHTPVQYHDWGHKPRNKTMPVCRGEYALHMDDDDTFATDAFKNVRKAIAEERKNVYIFKMRFSSGNCLWKEKRIGFGNTGTPMIVHKLDLSSYGVWEPFHGGDGFFMQTTAILNEDSLSWREEAIACIRPHDPHS